MLSANLERIGAHCNRKRLILAAKERRAKDKKHGKREALINMLIADRARTAKVKVIF